MSLEELQEKIKERLVLRQELTAKLEAYETIIRRLQYEKLILWEAQIINDTELRKLENERGK